MEGNFLTVLATGSINDIRGALPSFVIDELSLINSMTLLNKILNILRLRKPKVKRDLVSAILGKWLPESDPDVDVLIGDMASIVFISIANIAYIITVYEDIFPEEVLSLNLESEDEAKRFSFSFTASRLEEAYKLIASGGEEESSKKTSKKDTSFEENNFLLLDAWHRLLKLAENKNRPDAMRFIMNKIELAAPPAVIPSYIKKKAKKVPICSESEDQIKAAAKKTVISLTQGVEDSPELLANLDRTLETFDQKQLLEIVSTFDEKTATMDDPDMIEGPTNPIHYEDGTVRPCLGAPACRKDKSCRMLTCICVADDPGDADNWNPEKMSWFNNRCEFEGCRKKILKPSYAVRLPCDKGGFDGSFCSEDCAYKDGWIARKLSEEDDGEEEPEQYSKFNEIMAQIQYKGIVGNSKDFLLQL
jgi:hypothetical protein